MKMKKPDLSRVKEFLFEKGERVGLVVCGALAVLLIGMGIMKVAGSAEPFARTFQEKARQLDSLTVASGPEPKAPTGAPTVEAGWKPALSVLSDRHWPFTLQPDKDDENKRKEPIIFKALDDEKNLRVEYIPGADFAYDLGKSSVKAFATGAQGGGDRAAGAHNYVKVMRPARMLVITSVFPWQRQVEEFRAKLQYATLGDLQAKYEDMPQPLGLEIYRIELKPGQEPKETDWEFLYRYDPKAESTEVAERLQKLYREAMYDEHNPGTLTKHIHTGMVTPLPLLATPVQEYKKLDLPGITHDATAKPLKTGQPKRPAAIAIPRKGGAVVANVDYKDISFTEVVPPTLMNQFTGKIDWFDPSGILVTSDPKDIQMKMMRQRGGPIVAPGGKGDTVEDAIVRFVDVDVQPGKTYMYDFRVRMMNPNFGKTKDVAIGAMAEKKDLISDSSRTPPITIPQEYYLYALDQMPHNAKDTGDKGPDTAAAKQEGLPYGLWVTPFQIHRWTAKYTGNGAEFTIASWAIAERLLTRRGDTIGRHEVMVEVPVWDKEKNDFKIGFQPQKVSTKARAKSGLPLSFIQEGMPPAYLVDFHGGPKTKYFYAERKYVDKDESAVDVLVLTPGGKLMVRNSRIDSDPDTPEGRDRVERFNTWYNHVSALRNADTAANQAMPNKVNP